MRNLGELSVDESESRVLRLVRLADCAGQPSSSHVVFAAWDAVSYGHCSDDKAAWSRPPKSH